MLEERLANTSQKKGIDWDLEIILTHPFSKLNSILHPYDPLIDSPSLYHFLKGKIGIVISLAIKLRIFKSISSYVTAKIDICRKSACKDKEVLNFCLM